MDLERQSDVDAAKARLQKLRNVPIRESIVAMRASSAHVSDQGRGRRVWSYEVLFLAKFPGM